MDTITVWFSCGAASAIAARVTLDKYAGTHHVRVVNNPVAEEDVDNKRFLLDVEQWLGVDIEYAIHPDFPDCSAVSVWERERFMSGVYGAPCTKYLKRRARQHWENNNHTDYIVLGFTVDEVKRHESFILSERTSVLPVLIDAGLTKQDCFDMLVLAGIRPPRIYSLGYPNANCIGCVKATSPTYWNLVRRTYPDVFRARAEQSRDIGVRLVRVKGKRLYLDELKPRDIGAPLKSMTIECGLFCEDT